MSIYRYLLADLLTRQVNQELSLYGVTAGKRLNKPGNCTFTIPLGTGVYFDQDIIDATYPGRTALFIERDSNLVWGGIVWSRTYQGQGHNLSFTGQTFESWAYEQLIETDLVFTNMDQREILRQLFISMSAKPYTDIGILVQAGAYAGGILRTVTFRAYEGWSYGKAIEYMLAYDLGFDYTLDVVYDTNNNPAIQMRCANVLGTPIDTTQVAFDYPGNIKNYWYPESAGSAVTTMLGFGAGEADAMVRSKYVNQKLLDAGYPSLQGTYNNKDIADPATLGNQTKAAALLAAVPITVPTFEVNPQLDPPFGSYSLGDYTKIHIVDPRFPGGKELSTRILGWDIQPPVSDSTEGIKLIVSGQESA